MQTCICKRAQLVIILAVIILTALAAAEWSEPALVTRGLGSLRYRDFEFTCGPGDTLWAFQSAYGAMDTCWVQGQWSTGDEWSYPPVVLHERPPIQWVNPAFDDEGRLWVSWYWGSRLTDNPPWDSWGIYITHRDSSGWVEPRLAITAVDEGGFMAMEQSFCQARTGDWYLVMRRDTPSTAPQAYPVFSTMFSRLVGDTWARPRYIGRGSFIGEWHHRLTSPMPHPVTGLWTIHEFRWGEAQWEYEIRLSQGMSRS